MKGASAVSFKPLLLKIQFLKELVTLSHNSLFQRKWCTLIFQLFTYGTLNNNFDNTNITLSAVSLETQGQPASRDDVTFPSDLSLKFKFKSGKSMDNYSYRNNSRSVSGIPSS